MHNVYMLYIYMPYQLFCRISDPSTQNVFCAHENQCAFSGHHIWMNLENESPI